MGDFEIIDRLCNVNEELLSIVRKQAEVIAQYNISDDIQAELKAMRDNADAELDVIECKLRQMRR